MQFSDIRNKSVGLFVLPQLTSKVKQFYRAQIWTTVGQKSSICARCFTVRILLLTFLYGIPFQDSKMVWHCFLAQTVQKLLTFLDHENNSWLDKNIDKSTHRWHHLWFVKTYFPSHLWNQIYPKITTAFKK